MLDNLKYAGIGFIIGGCIFLGVGYKLFNKPELPGPAAIKLADRSQEKKSGTIKKYAPPATPGGDPILLETEEYESDTKNDIKSDSLSVLPDNYMLDSDFKTEVGAKYRLFEKIPVWIGTEYDWNHSELKLKASWSGRINL